MKTFIRIVVLSVLFTFPALAQVNLIEWAVSATGLSNLLTINCAGEIYIRNKLTKDSGPVASILREYIKSSVSCIQK